MSFRADSNPIQSADSFNLFPRDIDITELPEQARLRALSRLLAALAEHRRDVKEFRSAELDNKLLAYEEVGAWLQRHADREGTPSQWASGIPIRAEQMQEQGDMLIVKVGTLKLDRRKINRGLVEEPKFELRYLHYNTPTEHNLQKAVVLDGVLDRLRRLSQTLADPDVFHWHVAQATVFVLTRLVPVAVAKMADIDSQLTRRPRGMSTKHLVLAVFTQEHVGETLATRMQAWNAAHPEWAYTNITHFGGDSLQSVQRLLGNLSRATRSRSVTEQENPQPQASTNVLGTVDVDQQRMLRDFMRR